MNFKREIWKDEMYIFKVFDARVFDYEWLEDQKFMDQLKVSESDASCLFHKILTSLPYQNTKKGFVKWTRRKQFAIFLDSCGLMMPQIRNKEKGGGSFGSGATSKSVALVKHAQVSVFSMFGLQQLLFAFL